MLRRVLPLLVVVLVLCGCTPQATAGPAPGAASRGPLVPLSELETLANPAGYFGESTAVLAQEPIEPIAVDPRPELPVTVVDAQGTKVTITDASRILTVDIYGSLSATVFGLGLGDRVVGRDTSTSFPGSADLPLVTQNGHELNAEAILDLAPSVILTDTSVGPWDVMLQMRESGIPVVVTDSHRDMDNVDDIILQVADALGVPAEGRALADRVQGEIDDKIAEIAAIAPTEEADRVRMLFLYVRGTAGVYYMFGEGSGADSLIQALGGVDVATEVGWKGMRPVNAEALVQMEPDLLLMMTKGLESVDGVDGLLERVPAVANTPAGMNRRIVDMSDYEVLSFGPRTAGVLDALARAIYAPEAAR
ncbi:MAG: ABC transporter substrate-binding protein [Protaetiibacter sp.]